MKYFLLSILLLQLGRLNAQDSTSTEKVDVLLIPFEHKMYRSTIDPQLAQKGGFDYHTIREKMRRGLDDNLVLEIKGQYIVKSLLRTDTSEFNGEVAEIYRGIGYSYEAMDEEKQGDESRKRKDEKRKDEKTTEATPKERLDKLGDKMDNLFMRKKAKKQEPERMGTWVQNGQIHSQIDQREKYMKTVLSDPTVVMKLCKKHGAKKVLFINQLDILDAGDEFSHQRKIKVHYTIFNSAGEVVSSGAEISYFETELNDLEAIINQQFYTTTNAIAAKL